MTLPSSVRLGFIRLLGLALLLPSAAWGQEPARRRGMPATRPAECPDGAVREMRIIPLKHAEAEHVAKILAHLTGRAATIVPDVRTNSLLVQATPAEMQRVLDLVAKLDAPAPGESRVTQVYRLRHADPEETGRIVCSVFEDLRCTPDEDTSSLVLSGPEKTLSSAKQLLEALDQPRPEVRRQEVRVFALSRPIDDAILKAVQMVLGREGTVAPDQARNALVIKAPADQFPVVERVIAELESKPTAPGGGPLAGNLRLRVVWLVSGPEEQVAELREPPPDLAPVIEELERLGMGNVRLAGQMMVGSAGDKFEITASPVVLGPTQLIINGRLLEPMAKGEIHRVQIELAVRRGMPAPVRRGQVPASEICNLSSTLTVPLHHSVVFGMAPVEALSSAFVLQLLPAQPE